MKTNILVSVVFSTFFLFAADFSKEWPTYGHDSGGMRFSPLTEITPANVNRLKVAWVYHMKPVASSPVPGASGAAPAKPAANTVGAGVGAVGDDPEYAAYARMRGGTGGFSPSTVTPLVINGTMYLTTPYGRVVAIDSTTGEEVWAFELPGGGGASTRGVEYWPGAGRTAAQIVFGTGDGRLFSLDARTGKPNMKFGDNGVVNLNTAEIMRGLPGRNGLTTPPIVYQDLVITGGTTQENPPLGPAGDIRAWNMHTGKLAWTFHSIPREGEKYNDTWAGDSWKNRSGVNVWGFLTVDAERGIVYMPFGAPSVDQYGGDRAGDNLFSTSLVAADAKTGKYLWHFQITHHDIWDADLTGAPVLFEVKRGGRSIPAVAATNKSGLLFIFDRVTGRPIYGFEERAVAQSEVPEERTSKTQPFPLKPPPLSRMSMSAAEVATLTPELEAACKALMKDLQLGGPYLPVSYNRLGVRFPGNHGGVNWGGTSYHPQLGYLFVNSNDLGQITGLKNRVNLERRAMARGLGNRVHPDGPYEGIGGGRFSIPGKDGSTQQLPCQQPPWGQLSAINVNTGEFVWRVPLGITESLPANKQNTGRPGNGGTIVTAGGLVFVGATDDARFRAFEAKTGKELWTVKLGGAAEATPMTYQGRDGRQYVVITSTGGGFFNNPVTDDSIMAFALDGAASGGN